MAFYVRPFITFITHENDVIMIVRLLYGVVNGSLQFDDKIMTSSLCVKNVI